MIPQLWSQLDARVKLAVKLMPAVVGFVLVWRFAWVPLLGRLGEQRARLHDLEVKTADVHGLRDRLAEQEALLQQTQQRYELVDSRIGDQQSLSGVLEALSRQASEQQLQVLAIQPEPEDNGPRLVPLSPQVLLREYPLAVHLRGRYRHLGEFLASLPNAPFLVSVRSLELKPSQPGATQLDATLRLGVYLRHAE